MSVFSPRLFFRGSLRAPPIYWPKSSGQQVQAFLLLLLFLSPRGIFHDRSPGAMITKESLFLRFRLVYNFVENFHHFWICPENSLHCKLQFDWFTPNLRKVVIWPLLVALTSQESNSIPFEYVQIILYNDSFNFIDLLPLFRSIVIWPFLEPWRLKQVSNYNRSWKERRLMKLKLSVQRIILIYLEVMKFESWDVRDARKCQITSKHVF